MISPDPQPTIAKLLARRTALKARLWAAAEQVADDEAPELLTQLVRLRADIEAIDFAIQNAPSAD